MNKCEVVRHLKALISCRFQGFPEREIEQKLMDEGWSIGAIREAIDAASQDQTMQIGVLS
ncbi:MAG: hypothetical protein AAF636_13815 [Pseudomonadota bacterium]